MGRTARRGDTAQRETAQRDTAGAPQRRLRATVAVPVREQTVRAEPSETAGDTLAARIARLTVNRKALGCTQADLARLIGISPSSLSRQLRDAAANSAEAGAGGADIVQRAELALRLHAAAREQPAPQAAGTRARARATAKRAPAIATRAPAAPQPRLAPAPGAHSVYARPPLPAMATEPGWASAGDGRPAERRTRCRILIAEDDADTVGLYQMVFADDDDMTYTLDVARTAGECLERLRTAAATERYDLLLMDLGIGDMHGSDTERGLLDRLKRTPAILPPCVLVVSGISPYQLERKAPDLRRLRASFLSKPFDIEELLECVRSLLNGGCMPPAALHFFEVPARA